MVVYKCVPIARSVPLLTSPLHDYSANSSRVFRAYFLLIGMSTSLRNTIIGSICIAFGQLLFATNDAIIKLSNMKESQLLIGRFGIQFMIAIFWWVLYKPKNVTNWYGDKPYIINIWFRGISFTINTICLWYGVMRLPLGDATCIYYQSPLIIAMISFLFLGEKLPKTTPIICILAITGIIFLVQPPIIISIYNYKESQSLNLDGLIAIFIALFCWSISASLVRTALNTHFLQLEIVSAGQTLFISIPILLILNHYIIKNPLIGNLDLSDWSFDISSIIIMIIIGIFGFIALSLNVIGFQYGEATKVAWMEYIAVVFAFIYQIYLFNDIPNKFEVIGVVLLTIACITSITEEFILHNYFKNKLNKTIFFLWLSVALFFSFNFLFFIIYFL
eukprot:545233_1